MIENNWLLSAVERVAPGVSYDISGPHTGILFSLTSAEKNHDSYLHELKNIAAPACVLGVLYDDAHCCYLFLRHSSMISDDNSDIGNRNANDADEMVEENEEISLIVNAIGLGGRLVELRGDVHVTRVDEERAFITVSDDGIVLMRGDPVESRPSSGFCRVDSAIRRRVIEAKAAWGAKTDADSASKAPFSSLNWDEDCDIDALQTFSIEEQLRHHRIPSSDYNSSRRKTVVAAVSGMKRPSDIPSREIEESSSSSSSSSESKKSSERRSTLNMDALFWLQPQLRDKLNNSTL